MKMQARLAVIVGVLALAVSSTALAAPPTEPGSKGKGPHYGPEAPSPPGPKAPLPEQAKAHGQLCQGESKKHVEGEKGTAFSRCVKAAAQLRKHQQSEVPAPS